MVTFVLNHQRLRHEFSKRSSLSLLKYSDTRFAFNFLMLGRLRECSGALRGLFLSDEFADMLESRTNNGMECRVRAEDASWWEKVKTIDAMVKPIVHLLRVLDAMQPCIGKVYEAMDRMVEKLKDLVPEQENYEEIHDLCVTRWNSYHSPLHAAAYVLDPEFQGNKQESDPEVSAGWRIILDRLVPDPSARRKIRDQLSMYRTFQGSFGCLDAQEDRNRVGAALWWEDFGSDGPELQQLAVRILSQAVSSSCLEQLWSTYAHIASKKRNRLGVERANDLVFVSANLRMLCKNMTKKADPFTEWEMSQQDSPQEEVEHAPEPEGEDELDVPLTRGTHDREASTSCG